MTGFQARREVAACSARIWERGWVANHDGNVSVRAGDGFLVTPTGVSKRVCTAEMIVHCDRDGRPMSRGRPPSEVGLHVGAYRARAEVGAVLHAHPPYASAFALARKELGPVSMPEVFVSLGEHIPLGPLVLPRQSQLAQVAEALVVDVDAALLASNGALTVGSTLEEAYLRMELVEHYARIVWTAAGPPGPPAPLSETERDYLLNLRPSAARGRRRASGGGPTPERTPTDEDRLAAVVDREVRRALEGF